MSLLLSFRVPEKKCENFLTSANGLQLDFECVQTKKKTVSSTLCAMIDSPETKFLQFKREWEKYHLTVLIRANVEQKFFGDDHEQAKSNGIPDLQHVDQKWRIHLGQNHLRSATFGCWVGLCDRNLSGRQIRHIPIGK